MRFTKMLHNDRSHIFLRVISQFQTFNFKVQKFLQVMIEIFNPLQSEFSYILQNTFCISKNFTQRDRVPLTVNYPGTQSFITTSSPYLLPRKLWYFWIGWFRTSSVNTFPLLNLFIYRSLSYPLKSLKICTNMNTMT